MTERQQNPVGYEPSSEQADLMKHLAELQAIVDRHIVQGGKPFMAMDADEAVALMLQLEPYLQFEVHSQNVLRSGSRMLIRGQGAFLQPGGSGSVPIAMCEHHQTLGTFVGVGLAGVPSRENVAQLLDSQQTGFTNDASLAAVLRLRDVTSLHPSQGKHAKPIEPLKFKRLEFPLIYGMTTHVADVDGA